MGRSPDPDIARLTNSVTTANQVNFRKIGDPPCRVEQKKRIRQEVFKHRYSRRKERKRHL